MVRVYLKTFINSPDDDDPRCICSLCKKDFRPDPGHRASCGEACCRALAYEGYCDCGDCEGCRVEEDEDSFCIRLFSRAGDRVHWEARFHKRCFEQVFHVQGGNFVPLPGVETVWLSPGGVR